MHRDKGKGTANNSPRIEKGDIVTVMEDGKSNRGTWKLGRIVDIHPGNGGLVRGATVEVASRTGKRKLRRPVQRLFPLEVREASPLPPLEVRETSTCPPERQRRRAAIEGEARRRQVDQILDAEEDYDEL